MLDRLASLISRLIGESALSASDLAAIGIGFPGPVAHETEGAPTLHQCRAGMGSTFLDTVVAPSRSPFSWTTMSISWLWEDGTEAPAFLNSLT